MYLEKTRKVCSGNNEHVHQFNFNLFSAIAIPDVLVSAETKNGVDIRISRFSVPFGAALCRCGSGAFMVTVSLFLASMEGVELQAVQIVYVT